MEMPIECFWPSITLFNFHSQYFTLRTIDSYFKTLPIFNKSFAWYFDLTAKIPEPINSTDQIFIPSVNYTFQPSTFYPNIIINKIRRLSICTKMCLFKKIMEEKRFVIICEMFC